MGKLTRAEKRAARKRNNLLEVKDTCINCEQFIALDQRFCSHCGGKRIYNKLTWRNLIEDFVDRFLNLENSFLKTFIAMFKRPEDVIGGYMNGMRKKYLPAFSYFAVALTMAGIYAFVLKGWFIDEYIEAQTSFYDTEAVGQKEFATEWSKVVVENQSILMFLFIPFMAIISRIVFWNYKQYNFVEHFVIYLYAYSHIAMINLIISFLILWNSTLLQIYSFSSSIIMLIYVAYVLKRLFKLDAGALILKTSFFIIVLAIFSCFLSLPFVGYVAYMSYQAASGKEINIDENSLMGKLLKPQLEIEKERRRKKDSIRQDSLNRKKDILEISPEMIQDSLP